MGRALGLAYIFKWTRRPVKICHDPLRLLFQVYASICIVANDA
jgi:hypothetical protein